MHRRQPGRCEEQGRGRCAEAARTTGPAGKPEASAPTPAKASREEGQGSGADCEEERLRPRPPLRQGSGHIGRAFRAARRQGRQADPHQGDRAVTRRSSTSTAFSISIKIAAWTQADIAAAEAYLAFDGRIAREDWIGQAARLARGEGAAPTPASARVNDASEGLCSASKASRPTTATSAP